MGSFKAQIKIDATKEEVWEVLADLGNIYRWAPGVTYSCSTSEEGQGEGATRHCDIQLGPIKGYLEERAFDWRDGEGFKIEIYASSLPAKRIIVQFTVRADGPMQHVGPNCAAAMMCDRSALYCVPGFAGSRQGTLPQFLQWRGLYGRVVWLSSIIEKRAKKLNLGA